MNNKEFLEHVGVLGMKWGHRKGSGGGSSGPSPRQTKRKEKKAARKMKKLEARREKILASPRLLYKNRNKFSVEELEGAVKRLNMERNVSTLKREQFERGAKAAGVILAYTGVVGAAFTTGEKFVNKIHTLSDLSDKW